MEIKCPMDHPIKRVNLEDLEQLQRLALNSGRLRANHNLHSEPHDLIQRFFNAMEPGSYIRPHRHFDPPKWELLLVVRGSGVVLLFNEDGSVQERLELNPRRQNLAVEVPAARWHTLAALAPSTIFFELKPGPYLPLLDKDFAPWASQEGTEQAKAIESWFHQAYPGERFSIPSSER